MSKTVRYRPPRRQLPEPQLITVEEIAISWPEIFLKIEEQEKLLYYPSGKMDLTIETGGPPIEVENISFPDLPHTIIVIQVKDPGPAPTVPDQAVLGSWGTKIRTPHGGYIAPFYLVTTTV